MQLVIAFAVLGSLLIAGGLLVRPVPPSRLRGDREAGGIVLRPPKWRYAILAAMAVGPTVLVVVVAAAAARRVGGLGVGGLVAVVVATLVGLAVTGYFLLAETRTRVLVTEQGVERRDPLRSRSIAWGEVKSIAYNGVSRWFFLTGPGGVRLWIPEGMAGIGDFAEAVLARVPSAVIRAQEATHEALEQIAAEARAEDRAAGRGKP